MLGNGSMPLTAMRHPTWIHLLIMTEFALQMKIYLLMMSPPTVFLAQLTLHFLKFNHSQLWRCSFIFSLGLSSALRSFEKSGPLRD